MTVSYEIPWRKGREMRIKVEMWQAVWERATAEIEVPAGVEDIDVWLEDHPEWLGDAYLQIEDSVPGFDTETKWERMVTP